MNLKSSKKQPVEIDVIMAEPNNNSEKKKEITLKHGNVLHPCFPSLKLRNQGDQPLKAGADFRNLKIKMKEV